MMHHQQTYRSFTMPRYANGCGSGSITTRTPVVGWGQNTTPEAKEPEYHHGDYPADRVTRKHPAPRGESPKHLDAPLPGKRIAGNGHYPRGNSMTSAPGHEVRAHYGKIDPGLPRQIPLRDHFSRGHSFGSSNAAPQPRNRPFESYGRVKPQGKTG
jgi:hypothetical protein